MELFKELQYRTVAEEERVDLLNKEKGYQDVLVVDFQREQKFLYACKFNRAENKLFVLTKETFESLKDIQPLHNGQKLVVNHREALNYLVGTGLVKQEYCHYFDAKEVKATEDKFARLHDACIVIEEELKGDLPVRENDGETYLFLGIMHPAFRVIEMALHNANLIYKSNLATYKPKR